MFNTFHPHHIASHHVRFWHHQNRHYVSIFTYWFDTHSDTCPSCVKITEPQFCRIHWQCSFCSVTKARLQLHFQKLQRRTSDKNSVFSLCYFQVHHLQRSLPRKAENKGAWLAQPDFNSSHSPPQEERRILCTKTSENPPLEGSRSAVKGLLGSGDEKRRKEAEAQGKEEKGHAVPWVYDQWVRVWPVQTAVHTSMRTQEVAVGNGPRFCEGLELVEPLAGDVELQEAGFHHAEQTRHSPAFLKRVLVALSATAKKHLALLTSKTCGASIRAVEKT